MPACLEEYLDWRGRGDEHADLVALQGEPVVCLGREQPQGLRGAHDAVSEPEEGVQGTRQHGLTGQQARATCLHAHTCMNTHIQSHHA